MTLRNSFPKYNSKDGYCDYNDDDNNGSASISSRVFLDLNGNGIQDEDEAGLENITVQLFQDGYLVASTLTDSSGYYQFDGLDAGDYQIKFTAPEGFSFTQANVGENDAIDSDADLSGFTDVFTLLPGQTENSIDAGLIQTSSTLAISTRFIDTDSDIIFEKLVDEDGVDTDGDGKLEFVTQYYIAPEVGKFLYQEVQVNNLGGEATNNAEILIEASNPFFELIGIDYTGDGIVDPSNDQFTITPVTNADGSQSFLVEISNIGSSEILTFQAVSQVTARGDNSLTGFDFDFSLRDPSSTEEAYTAQNGRLYFSETGYVKNAGETVFLLEQLSDYNITFNLGADDEIEEILSAQPVRGSGTLVNQQTQEEIEYVLLDIDADADSRLRTSYSNLEGGTPTFADLELVWYNSPTQVLSSTYQTFVAEDSANPDPNLNSYAELIALVSEGLFSKDLASDFVPKHGYASFVGKSYNLDGSLKRDFSTPETSLDAISGNVFNPVSPSPLPSILIFDFPLDPPNEHLSLEEVLQNFDTYVPNWASFDEIIINFANLGTTPVLLSDYGSDLPWFSAIQGFLLPQGVEKLLIDNLSFQDSLDLSNIAVLNTNGLSAGVKVIGDLSNRSTKNTDEVIGSRGDDILVGTNGRDTMNGGFGNDVVSGGKGQDIFVIASGQGTDTFLDFQANQDSIGLIGGLTSAQLGFNSSTRTLFVKVTGEELAVFNSDCRISTIANISFQTV
ncbi:MAG: SdrD B-like domain-containing protein [Leptolyngbyaceae bacterium]|nr:SdrD B-like domain-containing protein [Leptolyngbyaceae bacterium]